MHLINDIYAVFRRSRREVGFFNERADAVYAVVARGVQLYNVQNRAVIQSSAHVALAAWIAVLGIQAIDRLRQNFCAGRFSRAARAGEQICVRDAPGHQFVF